MNSIIVNILLRMEIVTTKLIILNIKTMKIWLQRKINKNWAKNINKMYSKIII